MIFVILILFFAWVTNTLQSTLWGICKVLLAWYSLKLTIKLVKVLFRWLFRWLFSGKRQKEDSHHKSNSQSIKVIPNSVSYSRKEKPPEQTPKPILNQERFKLVDRVKKFLSFSTRITSSNTPHEWILFDSIIYDKYSLIGEKKAYRPYVRFLHLIKAIPPDVNKVPRPMEHAVVMKCMFEFFKKNLTLDCNSKSHSVTLQEVERPLASYEEAKQFYNFCVENYNR
jgi:hypothetical protein